MKQYQIRFYTPRGHIFSSPMTEADKDRMTNVLIDATKHSEGCLQFVGIYLKDWEDVPMTKAMLDQCCRDWVSIPISMLAESIVTVVDYEGN